MKNKSKSNIGEHEKYRYEECYAKILLERVYPEIYTDLSILDKPDLQNEVLQVGVEVTSAVPSSLREVKACWIKANNTNDMKIKSKYVKRMEQLGYKYTGGMQNWLKEDIEQLYELVKNVNVGKNHFRKIIINVIEDNEIVMIDTDEEKYSVISYDSRQYEYALAALDMIKKEDAE